MENLVQKEIITWNKSFETGNPVVDGQHKNLFKMINDLHSGIEEGSASYFLTEIIEKLSNYITIHFNTEEDLMLNNFYPGYKDHKKAHTELKEQADKLIKLFLLKKVDLTATISQFLSDWLQNHIKDTDIKFIEWLRVNENNIITD
jgi:hemerythrin